jgi:transposase
LLFLGKIKLMQHIVPMDRYQVSFSSLEELVAADDPVRFLDAFAEKLDLSKLGFKTKVIQQEGRPSFNPRVLLKIYLYGYQNGIRSSRRLEKECKRNTEMQWLCGKLVPNYHTIADFRKDNPVALKNMFKLFVAFLMDAGLISGKTIAIDGTKSRAHNSKKNNYSPKKIERHLQYIEDKTLEYLTQLDAEDKEESTELIGDLQDKIERLQMNQIKYEMLSDLLTESGEPQISTTDPDSRSLLIQGQVVEVCYNTQTAVDDKHKLVVATHTINRNDRNALSAIALEAKENLKANEFTLLADKGYNNAREIESCQQNDLKTIVAQQELVNSNPKGTTKEYLVDKFKYNKKNDTYTCPEGQTLTTFGTWHTKKRDDKISYQYKKYRTPACKNCPVKQLCTGRQKGGREIERSQYAEAVERNNKNYSQNQTLYRKRQEINEHIFGTIKRKWGYYYTNLIGLEKVNGEWSFIMLNYNIKRVLNIFTLDDLLLTLKNWKPKYSKEWLLAFIATHFNRIIRFNYFQPNFAS